MSTIGKEAGKREQGGEPYRNPDQYDAADMQVMVGIINELVAALATIASRADGYTHGDARVEAVFRGIAEIAIAALSRAKGEA